MNAITFDTLSSARRLREKGIPQEHAEAFADELRVAAQSDLSHLATKEEMSAFKSELKADMEILKRDLTIRLGVMQAAAVGLIVTLMKML